MHLLFNEYCEYETNRNRVNLKIFLMQQIRLLLFYNVNIAKNMFIIEPHRFSTLYSFDDQSGMVSDKHTRRIAEIMCKQYRKSIKIIRLPCMPTGNFLTAKRLLPLPKFVLALKLRSQVEFVHTKNQHQNTSRYRPFKQEFLAGVLV
jgi:hypothetical protein